MYNKPLLKIERSYSLLNEKKTMLVDEFYNNYVNFKVTHESCKGCEMYNKNWSCPPFDEDITQIWHDYKHIDFILLTLNYDDFITENSFTEDEINTILHLTLFKEKTRLLQKLYNETKEKEVFILSTGYCNLCSVCTKNMNNPCRYPNNKLYSIESIGGLVTKIAKNEFKRELLWIDMDKGRIPEHLNLLMAILY